MFPSPASGHSSELIFSFLLRLWYPGSEFLLYGPFLPLRMSLFSSLGRTVSQRLVSDMIPLYRCASTAARHRSVMMPLFSPECARFFSLASDVIILERLPQTPLFFSFYHFLVPFQSCFRVFSPFSLFGIPIFGKRVFRH